MHSVWYRQIWSPVVCVLVGLPFFAVPVVALVMSPQPATIMTGVLFAPPGLFLVLRSPRAATAANHHGFAMHAIGSSQFVPWCHVADLRVGRLEDDKGNSMSPAMYCAVATLVDGKRVNITPGIGTLAQTVKSERRRHTRVDALHQLRAGHQCMGHCVQERWYFGHHAPSTRATVAA